jgi:hypothetical protein
LQYHATIASVFVELIRESVVEMVILSFS